MGPRSNQSSAVRTDKGDHSWLGSFDEFLLKANLFLISLLDQKSVIAFSRSHGAYIAGREID